jgi:hypothetical protein
MGRAQSPAAPIATDVEWQPLAAQARRVMEALDYLGEPLSTDERARLNRAVSVEGPAAVAEIQRVLDARVLFAVRINPEMRVSVTAGAARAELVEQGWRQFLVKVTNEAGTTARLVAVSAQAQSLHNAQRMETPSDLHFHHGEPNVVPPPAADLWLDLQMYDTQPLTPTLSGLGVEYRIVQLFSRDAGRREAKISFNVGQGTQDIGFRNDLDLLFTAKPAHVVTLRIRDENGQPASGSLTIRDVAGRVYPSQAKRLAPDFAFHPQVYRADGETMRLPVGEYAIRFERGPESVPQMLRMSVTPETRELAFQVQRWIDPSKFGWWSGDHHIHASGCSHYTNPTEGVLASDMERHIAGEDLKVGATLTWGPGFDYQKQFFTGTPDAASKYPYLIRYDMEVSGFGSERSGHLCLLRLSDLMYPGGESSKHWPTLGMNTLRWAKKQGAVTGPAHSGWGLQPAAPGEETVAVSRISQTVRLATNDLPNYVIPPYNGIGANEYIVSVTHELPGPDGKLWPAVDFMSMVDTPSVWELNMWYHTLNAGFRTRISGESDFPCIYGERVGMGRSYVKLDGKLDYDAWCEGIRAGRNYVGDGKSHLMEFTATAGASTVRMGENGSELRLAQPGKVHLTARVAARLPAQPDEQIRKTTYATKPYWDIERARIGDSAGVPVEVVVNGYAVAKTTIVADGQLRELSFDVPIERSSWVTLRILPSSHTNPIWVMVGDKPVRPSRRSIEWCLKGVDQCWSQKERFYAPAEIPQAKLDYEHARQVYRKRLAEAEVE